MVNYAGIADDDPGGDFDAACEYLKSLKVSVSRGVFRITDQDIAGALGPTDSLAFVGGIEAAVEAGALSPRIMRWLEDKGIDINNPGTVTMLDALIEAGYVSQVHVDAVKALGVVEVPKYPDFRRGHLQNAQEKRAAGKI